MMTRTVLAVVTVTLLAGCGMFGKSDRRDERFARPGEPKASPSGTYTAVVEYGPQQNGVDTWVVVLKEADKEVFRDSYAYSTRHGVGVTWLSTSDQLWVLSSDVGASHVDRTADGTWKKTAITPETRGDVPAEINELRS